MESAGSEDEAESGAHYVRLSAYGSVQVQGLQKHACYGVVRKGAACADLDRCVLRAVDSCASLGRLVPITAFAAPRRLRAL